MTEAFLISFFNILAMIIWYKTDAFSEYLWFLPICKKYTKATNAGVSESFVDFLSINYNPYFIVRLVTCPYCFNFWITILTSYFAGYIFFPFIYFLSLINYKIFHIISKYE